MRTTRRSFLAGAGCATTAGLLAGHGSVQAATKTTPRKLLMVFASGGWDISYALDPKPDLATVDAPEGEIQMFEDIPVFVDDSRPRVTEFFEQYAPLAAVVNGINTRSIAHDVCSRTIFTGSSSGLNPDAGAMVGHQLGRDYPVPYLVLGRTAFSGPLGVSTGRVGATNQIVVLLDPEQAYPRAPGSPYFHEGFLPDADDEALIRQLVEARAERERAARGQRGHNRDRVDDFIESLAKGDLLRANAAGFGQAGDDLQLEAQVNLALDALEQDLAWAVNISADLGFDTHDDNAPQGPLANGLYGGLADLAAELTARPGSQSGNTLLDETTVVVFSEMSRTPRLNATLGKDHHAVTSALVFGAGVAGGRAYGATNDQVQGEWIDLHTGDVSPDGQPLEADQFVAGLACLAGADASEFLPNVEPFDAFIA
ncbi:MAG: DUF1501 domain-containing protein [Deltaproteobacteria bacterium]|nr:DUF1501 domain-containing protein [Deltaproteobacteria bacterium]